MNPITVRKHLVLRAEEESAAHIDIIYSDETDSMFRIMDDQGRKVFICVESIDLLIALLGEFKTQLKDVTK